MMERRSFVKHAGMGGILAAGVAPAVVQPAGMGKGMPPMPPPLQIGSGVVAQHQTGGWHPGRVVGMQNGMVAVDWADPKLGASAWLQPHQVQPGK